MPVLSDTLSGRSPLYHLEEFAESVDTGLLLEKELPAKAFNDTTMGRTLDAIYAAGTEQLFSQIALRAAQACPTKVDMRHVHFDTTVGCTVGYTVGYTSVSVWGDYPMCNEEEDQLQMTTGTARTIDLI